MAGQPGEASGPGASSPGASAAASGKTWVSGRARSGAVSRASGAGASPTGAAASGAREGGVLDEQASARLRMLVRRIGVVDFSKCIVPLPTSLARGRSGEEPADATAISPSRGALDQ